MSATYHHTTHKLSFKKIHYRYHPFCGTEVEVVRALRRFGEESFVVKLPDGHQIAVPAWMLDAVFCHQLPQRDHPLIALKALLQLAELIERHGLACQRVIHNLSDHLEEEVTMRSEQKRFYPQQRLPFVKKGLWEKLPQPSRVRCRELSRVRQV
jgi:hypothetical protein